MATVVEFGTYYSQYNVSFTAGDVFRVSVEGGVVKYKKNGVVYHTSPGIPTYPLKVDTALYTSNSTLTNAVVGGNWSGGSAGGGSSSSSEVLWLVADHLGTPRMILDQSGSLANIKRHDYLPFGEELKAGAGGRTQTQGYGVADGVRQGFTGYEKDSETGLDFAQARYYANTEGRFTSPDPLLTSGKPYHPQSWNRHTYCLNNPLVYIDPTGLEWRRHDETGVVKWYKDNDDRTGTTEWTEITYGIGNDQYVRLDPNGPNANGSSQEARQGWSVYTQASMQAGQPDNTGVLFSENWLPTGLFPQWLTGTGPTDRQFGPNDYMTQGMMSSPDVTTHRQNFIDQGGGTYGPTGFRYGLTAEDGPFESGFNMPRQFVGSFTITITERSNGDALFVIDNTTSLKSVLYQMPGVQNVERSTMAPLSNKTQTYFWTERGVIPRH